MVNFDKLSKLSKDEQEGIIKSTPEFNATTKLLAKWTSTKEDKHLQEIINIHPLVLRYALKRYIQQRQISKQDAQLILNRL